MATKDPVLSATIVNPFPDYTYINSVDFHPRQRLFCATFTHCNAVLLYRVEANGAVRLVQSLTNPGAALREPQHAIFSRSGDQVVLANWSNGTLAFYRCDDDGQVEERPAHRVRLPRELKRCKPHGIALSQDGARLAVAFGATSDRRRAIALFRMAEAGCELLDFLEGSTLPGIPKGIEFSPDGSCLVVTFSDASAVAVFALGPTRQNLVPEPVQLLRGPATGISRPEDVKMSPGGTFCAVSNSDRHTVTFHGFDPQANRILGEGPRQVLGGGAYLELRFPHGIGFSSDGEYLAVSEFGAVATGKDGDIVWDPDLSPLQAKVHVVRIEGWLGDGSTKPAKPGRRVSP